MKRLNQNNTIATTAMMTKTNTMKDKMNLFAKMVMLVVMMGMLVPNNAIAQETWTYAADWENNTKWYVLNKIDHYCGKTVSSQQQDPSEFSIYLPEASTGRVKYKSDGGVGDVQMALYIDGTESYLYKFSRGGEKIFGAQFGKNTHTIYAKNVYFSLACNAQKRRYSISIPVPEHFRLNDNNQPSTSITKSFNATQVGKTQTIRVNLYSFYIVTALSVSSTNTTDFSYTTVFPASGQCGQYGKSSTKNTSTTDLQDPGQYYIDITFNPQTTGGKSATFTITGGNGQSATISVSGTGLCIPTTINTTLTTVDLNTRSTDLTIQPSSFTAVADGTSISTNNFVLTSNNDNVVTILNGQKLHVTGAGSATITASIPKENRYCDNSCTFNVNVTKATPSISLSPVSGYVFETKPLTSTTTYDGQPISLNVNYSSNPGNNTIENNNSIKLTKCESTTITATTEETNIYKSVSTATAFTPLQVTPVLSWTGTELNRTFKGGDKVYLENYGWSSAEGTDVSKWQGISAKFTSSNEDTASVGQESDGRWYVLMNGDGKCDITMSVNIDNANAGNYKSYTPITHSVKVIKNSQTIVWNDDFSDMRIGGVKTLTAKSMTTDSPARETGLPITYTPNPSGIVTISNGTLTCAKAGYVTVTASQGGNDGYYEAPDETKSFEVDFEAGKTLTCSTAVVMGKSTTVFNLAGDMVKSGNLSLLSCSNTEFDVIFSGYDMNVTFIPTAAGERTADLAFEDDNMTYHLQLSATATAQTITFNSTEIGTSSLSTNSLDISAITLTSLSSNGNIRLVDNGTEHVLPYNGTINGPLTFKYYPTEVETNAEHTLTVNGTYEIIYNVTSTQHTINFADTKVGVATAQQQFEMTNFVAAGTLTAYTSSSEFRINGARYSSSVPLTIINGATLNIDFSPRNTCDFTTAPAQLIISDNGTLYKVNLTGKTEDLEPIDLGTVNIGQASELFEIDDIPAGTVTVTSTSPYVFRVFADDEEATLSTATANSSIDVSGKGKLYVKFYPETVGVQNETITISITDSYGETSSYSVRVSGTGVQQTLNISSTMGQLSGIQIALTNMVSAEGYTVSFTTEQEEFRINDDVVASIDVTGGSSLGIKLYPKTSGNKSETVTLLDKSTNKSYTINLTGTVTALPNLSFNQQKVAKTDVTDNKTITLSGWPKNRYELDILDNSETSYASSFLIRGVAGISSLVNGVNETVQFRPKKVFNTPLTLYAREKSSGILYPIAGITARSIQNDEVQLVWSDNSDPIMIGMNDCSYGFAYAVGIPELNVYYSVENGNINITTCGDATWGTKSGESSPKDNFSGLQGVNNGMTATVTAYILQSDEYLATPITRTFQVTDKLSQEIVYQYDEIVLTVGETFSLTGVNAPYAIDKVDKDATGAQISYDVNGGYISLNETNLSVTGVGSDGYLVITAAAGTYNEKEYLSTTRKVRIIGVQEEICDAEVCKLEAINKTGEGQSDSKTCSDFSKPVGYMSAYTYELRGYKGLGNYVSTLQIGTNNNTTDILNKSNNTNTSTGTVSMPLKVFSGDITQVKVVGTTQSVPIYGGNNMTVKFSGASLYQKKYFNKISNDISIDAGEAEQYSSTTTGYIEVANYSALNGIIRYRIVGLDAKSFKVAGTQTTVSNLNKEFTEISCGDLSTAKVKIEFTPQRVGNNYDATLQLIASTTVSGTIAYDTIEIPLLGTGKPRTQEVYWAQGEHLASLKYDDYIAPDADKDIELTAYSSIKGQDVSYAFCDDQGNTLETDPTFVSLSGKTLTINGAGDTYIKATQAGKTDGGTVVILPADPVILHIIVAKANPKLKWNDEYDNDWMYVFGSETIAAHSEPIEGNPSISGSTGEITYSTTTPDFADCTAEGSLTVNKYGEVAIKAVIAGDDNYLGGEEYAITKTFRPKKVTPVINWAEESLGNYKQGDVVTLENGLEATINKSTDGEPDVTLWSDDIAVAYSSQNTNIAKVSGNVVSLNGKKGVVTIQADVPVETNGNNNAAESKTRTMKVDFADSDIRDCGTAAVLQSCSTQPVNLSDEIITASNSSFSYIGSSNTEFTGSISNGVLTVTFTPTSVKEPATQTAVITIRDDSNNEEYHINVQGTAMLHPGSISSNTTAGHWTFPANAGTKTLNIASNGDIWGDQDEMNGAITLTSGKSNVTVGEDGKTITIVGGNADTDDDVTVTLTASFPGSDRIAACSTDITLTIQKLASGLALNKAELNNNAYVYSTIAMLADGFASDGDLNIEVTSASTHEISDGNNIILKSCVATTITATTAGTTIYKSGSDNVTFTPKKVTPEITWVNTDLKTDMSQTSYTIADADAAIVNAKVMTPEQPSIDDWVDGKNITYSVVGNEGIITLSSGRTFTLNKVGYATIKAKVENGDNIIASNELTRHLKVDFNPNEPINCGESMVFESCSTVVDLDDLMVAVGNLTVTVPQGSEFSADLNQEDNTLTIIYSPKTIKEVNPTEEILTITDHGPGAQYHLHVIGTASLYTPILNVTATKHDNWIFKTTPNRATTTVIYGFSNTYDIYWSNTPSAITAQDAQVELDRVSLSLKNPSDATYVEIVDNGRNFRVKQSKADSDDDFVVTLVASYPGQTGKMAPASVDVPINITKTQYTLDWHATEKTIYAGDVTTSLNKPDLTPTRGVSTIQYSYSKDGVISYDETTQMITLTTAGKKESSVTLIASVESDIYGKGTRASITVTIKKRDQYINWDAIDIYDFTTQRDTTLAIDLQAFAQFKDSTKANIFYNVTEVSNCDGEGPLIRIDTIKTTTPYTHKLYYTGNGSGKVTIVATASGTDDFNPVQIGSTDARKEINITKEGCTVNDWTVNNMRYGDKVVLEPTVDKFTRGENYEYTLPTVTGTLDTAGNVLNVKGVGNGLTISAKKLEDCWVNESEGSTASNTFNIAKSEQEIEWDKTVLGTPKEGAYHFGVLDGNAYQLATQAIDKLHKDAAATWLLLEGDKYVTANVSGGAPGGLSLVYSVVEQDGVCKVGDDKIVSVDNEGKMHITGNGTGTVLVIASVDGRDYYENVSETITVVVDKATPTVAVTGPVGILNYGTGPHTLTASSTVGSYSSANDPNAAFTYKITEGTDVASINNDQLTILKSGTVKVTATQTANCIVNSATSEEYTITIDRADPLLKWSVEPQNATYDPANNTQSLSVTTNSDAAPTFSVTPVSPSTDGATINQSGVLTITKVGTYTVTVTLAETDKYNSASINKTIVISKADADFFSIADITMIYNDEAISLDNDISGGTLTLGRDYQVSYSVGVNGTGYFNVDDANKTINPLKANVDNNGNLVEMTLNASITGMTNYNDKQITGKVYVQRATQAIVWSGIQTSYDTWNVGGEKTINLDDYTQSKDVSHGNAGITPDLTKTYELVISNKGCDIDNANVAYIDNYNVLHITGATSAILTIYAKQDGTDVNGENYTKVEESDKCTTVITINKITPIISFGRSNVNGGADVYYSDPIAYTVSSTGTDYSVSDVSAFTFDVTPVDGGAISENFATHAGNVKIKASQAEDCMINGVESGEVNVEIKKAPQSVSWKVTELGTLSATSTEGVELTAVAMNSRRNTQSGMTITYTVCDAEGNDITSDALITIGNDNKVYSAHNGSGEAWVKAVANGDDNYEASKTPVIKKITIEKEEPTITWTYPCSEQMTMNYSEEKELTFSCDYSDYTASYTLTEPSDDTFVDITELANGKVKIIGVKPNDGTIGIKVTVTDSVGNYSGYELNTTITTQKNNTEIDWNNQSFGTYTTADAGTEIVLTAFVKDSYMGVNSEKTVAYDFKSTNVVEGCGNIVELTGDGKLKITGNAAGTVTLYASYAGDENYNASTEKSMQITVGKQTPSFAWADNADIQATYGETGKTAVATHDGTGTVTYGSSKPTVATIAQDGKITIVGAGTTTLSAILAADCKYEAVTTAIEKTLTVGKAPCTITVTGPQNITFGQTGTLLYSTKNTDASPQVTFTSGNTNIVSISGNQATGAGAGTTYVYAEIAESDNYLQATSDDFNITVVKAQTSFTIDDIALTYGDLNHAVTIYNGGITDYTVSFNIDDGDKSYISINSDNTINAIGAKCGDNGNLVNIPVTAHFTSTNYEIADVTFNVTVAKADQTITWDENKDYNVSNMKGSIDLSDYCTLTVGGVNISFTSSDDDIAEVSGNDLIIKKITTGGTVIITATAEGTANYKEATESREFTITVETPIITVIGGGTESVPLDLSATEPKINSVTNNVDLAAKLVAEGVLTCNYQNVTYTFVSDNTDIATFDESDKRTIISYKRSDALKLTVTAKVDENHQCSTELWVKIPRGTMIFNRDGNWHGILNGGSNWQRRDMLPSADDHNVSIQANCTIDADVPSLPDDDNVSMQVKSTFDNITIAECYNLDIAENGSLTVDANDVLKVEGTFTNSEASKLKLEANENNSATVLFAVGSPRATVESYIKGELHPEGNANNPDWQYRGFVGNNPSLSGVWNVVIFKWNETLNNTNCWGTAPVYTMETVNYSFSPWDGYCMANYDGGHERKYTSKLIPSDTTMTYNLSYTDHGQQYPNRGVNLITNSWSAPIDMSSTGVVFDGSVENTFYFYQTRNHNAWEADSASTFVVYPKNTGHVTASSNMIASGQSFLVRATGSNASLTINGGALAHQANGFMYAPAEKERFNVLSITMSVDTMADRLFLLESENCSGAFDNGYDGTKIEEGNMSQIFASNDFGHTAVNTDKTMLGQRIGYSAAEDGALCTITFNTDRLEGFSELYLYDRATKRYADILAGDSYSFTGTKAGEEERFEIVGRRDDGSEFVTSSDMMIEVVGNRALLSGFAGGNDEVFITDMNGKRLWTERASNGPWFELPNLPAGVYLINCGEANCKFIVK